MGILSKIALKNLFKTGRKPVGDDFSNLIDSFVHATEGVSTENVVGLKEALQKKMDVDAQGTLTDAFEAAVKNIPKPWTPVDAYEDYNGSRIKKLIGYTGGTGQPPVENIGMYYAQGGFTGDKAAAINFALANAVDVLEPSSTAAVNSKAVLSFQAVQAFNAGSLTVVGNLYDKSQAAEAGKYFSDDAGTRSPLGGWNIVTMQVKPSTRYTSSFKRFAVFYGPSMKVIAVDMNANSYSFTTPANCAFVGLDVNDANLPGLVVLEGSRIPQYDVPAYNRANYQQILEPEWKRIIATRNSADFNSIRELANSLMPYSNYYNRYEIFVGNGEWRECDWQGWGDYVRIVGESMVNTSVCVDQAWTDAKYVTPADFPYGSEQDIKFSAMSPHRMHIVFATRNIAVENLTFEIHNGKYAIHLDNPNYTVAAFKRIRIIERQCNYPVGIGINGGQEVYFEDVYIDRDTSLVLGQRPFGIFAHNWDTQKKKAKMFFKNVKVRNAGYLRYNELGSACDVHLVNCSADTKKIEVGVGEYQPGKTFYSRPDGTGLETNPGLVPYTTAFFLEGTPLDGIDDAKDFSTTAPALTRPGIANFIF